MDRFTVESLHAALGERPFRFYESVDSTQNLARDWALSEPDLPGGAVVIAEAQTAGRGRQGRIWHSPPSAAIMCSMVLRPTITPEKLPRLMMVGGLAVLETLEPVLPGAAVLKWPNDVLINRRKLCGILAEATWLGERLGAVILGIGLNVRTDFAGTDLAGHATSLETELGRPVDRHPILANLLQHVDVWTRRLHDPALLETWRARLGTLGRPVTVYPQVGDPFSGLAESVDENGALFVRLESGEVRRVLAADVGLWEE